jgi:hypothetical protein
MDLCNSFLTFSKSFIEAGQANGAPQELVDGLENMLEWMSIDLVWRAPEELAFRTLAFKKHMSRWVLQYVGCHTISVTTSWVRAMKNIYETTNIGPSSTTLVRLQDNSTFTEVPSS